MLDKPGQRHEDGGVEPLESRAQFVWRELLILRPDEIQPLQRRIWDGFHIVYLLGSVSMWIRPWGTGSMLCQTV